MVMVRLTGAQRLMLLLLLLTVVMVMKSPYRARQCRS